MRDKSISDDYIDFSGLTAEERDEFSRISDRAIVRGFGEFDAGELDDRWTSMAALSMNLRAMARHA